VKLLTLARDLVRRKARERQGLFVAEGVRAVEELLASPLRIRGILSTGWHDPSPRLAGLLERARERGVEVTHVTQEELESASDTETPQGVLAVAEIPARTLGALALPATARVVVLDALQDPGNVGTILRTAAAFGAAAVVALPGTVDLWNAKVVRSAMGIHFRHPAVAATWDELSAFLREHRVALWAADAEGEPLSRSGAPARLAIAVGNEGAGLSAQVRDAADRVVSVPIARDVESLNVAVAAGVILYELRA
jgi:TrmH family RNA methyltransferase